MKMQKDKSAKADLRTRTRATPFFSKERVTNSFFQPRPETTPASDSMIQRKIKLTGTDQATRDKFMKKVNEGAAVSFKTDKDGMIVPSDPKAKGKDVYTNYLMDFINDPQEISLRMVAQSDTVFTDDFATGEVDSADILKLPTDLFHNDLIHMLMERISVKDYEKVKVKNDIDVFNHAHNIAIHAEEKFLKSLYPKKHIEYNGAHTDNDSRKVDKDGNGTIIYYFDFTDVQKIFVQPVVKGETVENIVKAYIKVIR